MTAPTTTMTVEEYADLVMTRWKPLTERQRLLIATALADSPALPAERSTR
jgi:hypothetical protein